MSLAEARRAFHDRLREGSICPCCDRYGKIIRVKAGSSMTRSLIQIYRYFQSPRHDEWLHVVNYLERLRNKDRTWALFRWWQLLEKHGDLADDGNPNNGYYRMTELGNDWVERRTVIPHAIYHYNNQCLGFDESRRVLVDEALGVHFNYREMMNS